ncbi:TPR domain-containing glycosyltransferase [Paenibacillus sp. Marseille-Q4541]|uniref:tetratricopeptide repeat-containing glycosyltransferase family 2 protein n=1 Tax=Paenibacillus sp. Marseille-Q4541 TaxID=2831522 RepID=UPI001BAC1D37|nr:TPR domain-containing glycosyltransferase [Paenibacillus sp. Marseille-Q4541]
MSIPTLGVHMIIYNEEAWLGACLEQIDSMADELIIVDTGSTDRSIEIAEGYGATVIRSPWENDFAKARNAGLTHATTDWILVLDADEQVIAGQEEIKPYLQQEKGDLCLIQFVNWTGQSVDDYTLHLAPRLFRNRRGYLYEGTVHEQLIRVREVSLEKSATDSDRTEAKVSSLAQSIGPLKVNHYGYLPEVMASRQTALRNLKLIQTVLDQQPEDAFHIYNLGVTYCQLDDRERAKVAFSQSLRTCPLNAPYRATLVRDLGKLLYADYELEQARALLLMETQRYPDYADLQVQLGLVEWEQGMLAQAYLYFEKATKSRAYSEEQATPYITEAGSNSYIPLTHMANIDKCKGQVTEAEKHYRTAMRIQPGYLPAVIGLADLLQKEEVDDSLIQQILLEPMDRTNSEHLYKAAFALMLCGAYEAALSILPEQAISTRDEGWVRLCLIQTKREANAVYRAQQLLDGKLHTGQLGRLDPVTQPDCTEIELAVMDGAICYWATGESLSEVFFDHSQVNVSVYREIERRLGIMNNQEKREDASPVDSAALLVQSAEKIAVRAASCGQKELLLSMWKAGLLTQSRVADLLYKHGFRREAAEHYLEQLTSGHLNTEGMFHLAEYMYDRAIYTQSLVLFEHALSLSKDHSRSRMGAAASCLQLAREATSRMLITRTAKDSEVSFSILAQDLAELTDSVKRMDDLGWRTSWSGQERRRTGAGIAE